MHHTLTHKTHFSGWILLRGVKNHENPFFWLDFAQGG